MTKRNSSTNPPAHANTAIGPAATASSTSDVRKTCRSIQTVIDARDDEPVLVPVGAVLDGLPAAGLTNLRREIATRRQEASFLFRCGNCHAPVYVATSPASSTGDGHGAFFKHYSKTPDGCDWLTDDALRSVGAVQFDGATEGEEHQRLKTCLADSIRHDPDFSEPVLERYIQIGEGRRKPDVFTHFKDLPIALEIQLARLPVTTIIERTLAYQQAGITLVWVTSADELSLLNTQAFRDLYLATGGRIFVIDAASYDRSEETGTFHLRELSLEPCVQPAFAIYNRWRSRLVGPDVILMPEGQRHAEGQRAYGTALAEKLQAQAPGLTGKITDAIATGTDPALMAAEWSALGKLIGARSLRQAIQDDLPMMLRWLQAVERATNAEGWEKETAVKTVAACAAQIIAAHRSGKHWIPLIEHVADTVPAVAAAIRPDLRARMTRLKASPDRMHPFHAYHRQMIAALHPWLAYWLLARAPAGKAPR